MSEDEVECEYCGDSFDKRGIGAHQASCDEAIEETTQPDYDDSLEAKVRARDDGACVRCGATDSLTLHIVDPDVGSERIANVLTLCADCDDDVEGLHPRTKRSKIHSDR